MDKEYWDEIAGPAWVADQKNLDATLAPYAHTLEGALSSVNDGRIVDVGCGCGATTLLARKCAPRAEILGLDVSRPMLALAEQRARGSGDDATCFVRGDAAEHAVEAGTVDLVISRFGVMFFADPAAAFAHMREWLAPGAKMVVVVWAERGENPWMTEMVGVLARHFELPASDPNAPGPFALGHPDRRRAVWAGAGLRVTEETSLTSPVRVRGDLETVTSFYAERGPLATALREAEPKTKAAAMASLRARVGELHDGDGISLPAHALRITLVAT